ncbi:unnamed protein product [Adineta steineri]|uniref:Uncharacterized protein n=1 Tax=Adineta steineri TaxID=433720 RepID=A0A813PCW0_9BILA|nr:unnamed protein product [Adineta steineri]CAF0821258.1 unnamed protein product [Adineta steineri]CAF0861782.1 unnamed protein product [Adineta steineri]
MSSNDDQTNLSPQPGILSSPHINPQYPNLTDLDDIDDDDEGIDDECLDSIDEIQHILQTFGTNDSSTLTIDYFDSRRYAIMYEIMNVEKQFEQLKNILYDESVSLIDQKLLSIQNEEAPEYQEELKKLYDDMQLRLEIAKQRRHIELESLENSYQAELLSLQQTLENDKFLLHHQMYEDIQRKIDELETLKSKTQLCSNILQEMFSHNQQQLISPNKKRFESPESLKENKKQRKTNLFNGSIKTIDKDNLAIFYQLSDIDIIEDWALIQSSLHGSNHDHNNGDEDNNDIDDDDDDDDDDANNNQMNVNCFKQEQFDYDENRV